MIRRTASAAGIAAALGIFYLAFVHYTDSYEVALVWNRVSGALKVDTVGGFDVTPPWVAVSRIDTRPTRVCMSTTARAYNCKLVQFDPRHAKEFIAAQGFHYYWLANRISFNSGYDDEYRGMRDILRGYAYGAKKYPFITVLESYAETP